MSDNFQDLMKQVHRKDNVNAGDAPLHPFHFVSLDSFLKGGWDKPAHLEQKHLRLGTI